MCNNGRITQLQTIASMRSFKINRKLEKQSAKTLKPSIFITALFLIFAFALPKDSHANLVQNGNFTSVVNTPGTTGLTTLYGQFGTGYLTVSNWSTTGYNFVYAPNTVDVGTQASGANSGQPNQAPGQYNAPNGYGSTFMWGSNNGGVSTFPSTSPAGGNFIAMDGAFETAAVTQTITGLTVGQVYVLKFYWAGAQQQGFTGITTDNITATLGSQSFTTSTVTVPSMGFSGWVQQTFYYTATSTSATLSFLAAGTPTGEPPFSLLGGVDLQVVPDFSNWMVFAAFGTVCIVFETVRRRREPAFVSSEKMTLAESSPDSDRTRLFKRSAKPAVSA